MSFDLPQEYNEAIKNANASAVSGIPLPYPAPELYWRHADAALASVNEIKDARRFGGWGVDKNLTDDINGLPPELPRTWTLFTGLVSRKDGKTYDAYMTRSAWVAPIVRRYRWNDYSNRSEVQYLCYFAETVNEKMTPWGLVVVSAKSLDTKPLDACFREFENKTAQLRGSTRHNFFFIPVGTFGNAPKFETRSGKGGASSQVTPPQLYIPKDGYTVDLLKTVFVGLDIAKEIKGILDNPAVKEWADDWNAKKKNAAAANTPPEEPGFMSDPAVEMDEGSHF